MQGAYYLAMLIGVAWLCAWVAFPDVVRRYPSPFDMRTDNAPRRTDPDAQPWRRAGRGEPPAPPPPADLQHPLPKSGAAKPWRLRGEQAAAPDRKRRG
jgi:hypothetical protein